MDVLKMFALQWGRGFSAAEIRKEQELAGLRIRLQWGRGFSAAEMKRAPMGGPYEGRLQWGRGFSAAEIPRTPTAWPLSIPSFNGAAAFQPRKSQCPLA